jgi:hypothetical protein
MSQLDRLSPAFKEGLLEMIRKSPDQRELVVKGAIKTAHVYVDKVVGPWLSKLSSEEIAEVERLLNEVGELDEKTVRKALSHPFSLPISVASR